MRSLGRGLRRSLGSPNISGSWRGRCLGTSGAPQSSLTCAFKRSGGNTARTSESTRIGVSRHTRGGKQQIFVAATGASGEESKSCWGTESSGFTTPSTMRLHFRRSAEWNSFETVFGMLARAIFWRYSIWFCTAAGGTKSPQHSAMSRQAKRKHSATALLPHAAACNGDSGQSTHFNKPARMSWLKKWLTCSATKVEAQGVHLDVFPGPPH